jgi:hypothetical protein
VKHRLAPLDPRTYRNHPVHGEDRAWPESNCYVDLWIETLHGFGLDPVAGMAFTLALDFEGDQWTFFKYPLEDIYALYHIEVKEMNIWRPLLHHVEEQVGLGRVMIVEVDSYFLPDTAGVSYKTEHVKTSIAIQAVDSGAGRLGYFHGKGYYHVEGEDFGALFRLGRHAPPEGAFPLPPYVEMARIGERRVLGPVELTDRALELARFHLARRPATNPVARFRPRFLADLEWLATQELPTFHGYSFGTLRQCGACCELASTFVGWLAAQGVEGLEPAAADLEAVGSTAKTLQFKLARAVNTRKPVDFSPMLDRMETGWAGAMDLLDRRLGS